MSHEPPLNVTRDEDSSEWHHLVAAGHLGWGADVKIKQQLRSQGPPTPAEDAGSQPDGTSPAMGTATCLPCDVVLSLADVTFIDSAGISSLLSVQNEVAGSGGKVVLCAVPPLINQTFQVVGMSRLIPVVEDVEQAREVLKP